MTHSIGAGTEIGHISVKCPAIELLIILTRPAQPQPPHADEANVFVLIQHESKGADANKLSGIECIVSRTSIEHPLWLKYTTKPGYYVANPTARHQFTTNLENPLIPLIHQFPLNNLILSEPPTQTGNRREVWIVGSEMIGGFQRNERSSIFIHQSSRYVRHGFPRRVAASVFGVELLESRHGD